MKWARLLLMASLGVGLSACVTPKRAPALFPVHDEKIFDATRNGDLATIQKLLASEPRLVNAVYSPLGVRKPSRGDNFTPLHFACLDQRYDVAAFLIKSGADVNADGGNAWRPLHEACSTGFPLDLRIVELLIENGAELEAPWAGEGCDERPLKRRPIHIAARAGHLEVLKVLLNHGAQARALDGEGKNALNHALEAHQATVAKYLVEDVHLRAAKNTKTIQLRPEWRWLEAPSSAN